LTIRAFGWAAHLTMYEDFERATIEGCYPIINVF